MFGRKSRHGNILIFVDDPRRYLVRIGPRALRKPMLIAVGPGARFDILDVGCKNMLRHRLDTLRAIHLKWGSAPYNPRREDEVRISDGMVRVQMGRERHPQV